MTTVAAIVAVPDSSKRSDPEFWEQSRNIYNGLPVAEQQPEIPDAKLQLVENLLRQHGLQDLLGVHLVHRHDTLPERMVSVGTYEQVEVPNNTDKIATCWTKPTTFEMLPDRIHGNNYVMTEDGLFFPYDFVQGDSPFDLSGIDPEFLSQLAALLEREGLEDLVALQVVHGHPNMIEFELRGCGTVMIDSSFTAKTHGSVQTTGWKFGIHSVSQYEAHRKGHDGHHIVLNAGSPLTVHEIVRFCQKEGGILSF